MPACTCANPTAVANAVKSVASSVDNHARKEQDVITQVHRTLYGEAMGGRPGAPAPVRFCHWVTDQVGAAGKNAWVVAFQGAAIAIALANSLAQEQINAKKQDLAEGYYDQAKYRWDRFKDKYIPLEKKLLREVSTEPIRRLNCADDQQRAQNSVALSYGQVREYLKNVASGYRMCIDESLLDNISIKQGMTFVDTTNYNMQDDQFYTNYKNDQRWNRRSNVLNLGRNLSSETLRYGDVARTLLDSVGGKVQNAANGVMQALGYFNNRIDTTYPTTTMASNTGTQIVSMPTTTLASARTIDQSANANALLGV